MIFSCDSLCVESTKFDKNDSILNQRKLIDQHLDMSLQTGVSSRGFILDEEIKNSNSPKTAIASLKYLNKMVNFF